jgi:hypothetical protein
VARERLKSIHQQHHPRGSWVHIQSDNQQLTISD